MSRGLLAHEEARREAVNDELVAPEQLQQVLVDEEMLRERRGARAAIKPTGQERSSCGYQYASFHLPDEQVELNLFGFKVAVAVTTKRSSERRTGCASHSGDHDTQDSPTVAVQCCRGPSSTLLCWCV